MVGTHKTHTRIAWPHVIERMSNDQSGRWKKVMKEREKEEKTQERGKGKGERKRRKEKGMIGLGCTKRGKVMGAAPTSETGLSAHTNLIPLINPFFPL